MTSSRLSMSLAPSNPADLNNRNRNSLHSAESNATTARTWLDNNPSSVPFNSDLHLAIDGPLESERTGLLAEQSGEQYPFWNDDFEPTWGFYEPQGELTAEPQTLPDSLQSFTYPGELYLDSRSD